jgi:hypothetical protein
MEERMQEAPSLEEKRNTKLIQGSSCFSRFACADPQMEYIMSF